MSQTKKQKKQKQYIEPANYNNWCRIALILLLGLLLFYPPYFQGLFFKQHMFATHIITCIIFILVWINKYLQKDFSFISGPLDWAVLSYAVAYALSLTTAVVIGEAVYGFLRALNYFMIYWIIAQVVKDHADIRTLLKILLISGLGVTVIGILAATGLIDYPQAIVNNSITSTLGYHNTLVMFLAVLSMLGTALAISEKNRWWQIFYYVNNYLMALVIIAAISKGAWIAFAFGLFVLIIGMPKGYRIKVIYFLTITIGSSIIISNYFIQAMASKNQTTGIWFVLSGVLLVLGGWILWRRIEPWLNSLKLSRPVVVVLIFAVLIAVTFAISKIGLSDNIITEVSEITDTENLSYVTRVDFMRWAADIIQDYPLTGSGAGGWGAIYRQYQDYNFLTTETHSHVFQVGVETGLIGAIAFLAMWVVFIGLLFRLYKFHRGREEKEEWVLICGIAAAAMGLGLHSCFDFDLSLPAMAILLWSLLALISVCYSNSNFKHQSKMDKPWMNASISVLLVLVLLVSGGRCLLAYQQAQTGQRLLQSNEEKTLSVEQLNQAGNYFAQAVKNDPRNAEYWSYLASLQGYCYRLLYEPDPEQASSVRQRSIAAANHALDLNPYDVYINQQLTKNQAILGDLDGLIRVGKLYIKTLPNDPQAYKKVAALWWDATCKCEENKQHDLALKFAGEIIMLDKALQDQLRKVDVDHPFWQGEKLGETPEYEQIYRQAQDFIAAAENS
mgnify:CR=1 FL=1